LGGEGVLRTHGKESAARKVIHSAAQQGTGRPFAPLSPEEQRSIIQAFQPVGRKLAFYRGPQG